jgi:hypothetical protein
MNARVPAIDAVAATAAVQGRPDATLTPVALMTPAPQSAPGGHVAERFNAVLTAMLSRPEGLATQADPAGPSPVQRTMSLGDQSLRSMWSGVENLSDTWTRMTSADATTMLNTLEPSDPLFGHKMLEWQLEMGRVSSRVSMPATVTGMLIKGVNTLTRM